MKRFLKILPLFLFCLACLPAVASAQESASAGTQATFAALLVAAFLAAVIHTIAGPDHYLPFVAIAKSRQYSLPKTLVWTFICGIGHIASALLLAFGFIYFSHIVTDTRMEWIEENRSNLAAYAMIGFGGAYLLFALRHRFLHKHAKEHRHGLANLNNEKSITPWVLFIIFVLGPCEALLPILTASSVLGMSCVIASTIVFSISTIATMMVAVAVGLLGLKTLRFDWLEKYASEFAGATVMACGLAIVFLGL